ncbi:MAG: hypothetical protein ACT4PZ_21235 [Panacagrimonas sp.]
MPVAVLALSGCGGGSSGSGGGNGGGGGSNTPKTCQESFDPARIPLGDDCSPVAGEFCPTVHYGDATPSRDVPIPCTGITITRHAFSGGGFDSEYLAIRAAGGSPESVYMQLHYLGGDIGTHTNQLRLSELAKARNVLIIVPQAPSIISSLPLPGTLTGLLSGTLASLLGIVLPELPFNPFLPELSPAELLGPLGDAIPRWPNTFDENVDDYVALLDNAVADARSRFALPDVPLFVGGLSNGGPMSVFYACKRPNAVAAIEPVGVNVPRSALDVCPAFAAVVVNGTRDVIAPYNGNLLGAGPADMYADFKLASGCLPGNEFTSTIPAASNDEDQITVVFKYTGACTGGKRQFLVTLEGAGHNWPSQDVDPLLGDINLLGGIARNWDATIYGYDLMKLAAGIEPQMP